MPQGKRTSLVKINEIIFLWKNTDVCMKDIHKQTKTGYRQVRKIIKNIYVTPDLLKQKRRKHAPSYWKDKKLLFEHKLKISKSLIGNKRRLGIKSWNTGLKGAQVVWNKGKIGIYSEETKQKMRQARLKQNIPRKDTMIETELQKELKLRKFNYDKHIPVCGCCQPDIVFPEQKVAVFADGDYWHNLPSYVERDKRINKTLKDNGWSVLRFCEHEINTDVGQCVDKIAETLF